MIGNSNLIGRAALPTATALAILLKVSATETAWKTIDTFRAVRDQSSGAGSISTDLSGTKIFAVGGARLDRQTNAAVVRVSGDAGKTWTTGDLFVIPNAGTDFWFGGIGAAPGGSLFAAGEAYKYLSGKNWIIRKSSDQGVTWSTCDYLTEWQYYPSAWDLKAAASGEIFAVGTYGGTCCPEWRLSAFQWFVRRSLDDGNTWQTVDVLGSLAPYNFSTARAIAIAGKAIFVVGSLSLNPDWYGLDLWTVRRSTDKGNTWRTVDVFQPEPGQVSSAEGIAITPDGQIFVVGTANGGSANSPVGYWVVRRSLDGGESWGTVDSLVNPADRALVPKAIASDSSGRLWVCGFSQSNWERNGWLVRRGVAGPDDSVEWANSDFVGGKYAGALGVVADRDGRILVTGHTPGVDGISEFTTRVLDGVAAALDPTDDPFTPENPSPFVGLLINTAQAENAFIVSWPQSIRGAILEYSDVIPATEWKPTQNIPVPIGNESVVVLDMSARARFFRLRQK